jgi:hypothetical protein
VSISSPDEGRKTAFFTRIPFPKCIIFLYRLRRSTTGLQTSDINPARAIIPMRLKVSGVSSFRLNHGLYLYLSGLRLLS